MSDRLREDIEKCLRSILGGCYVHCADKVRRKSGVYVWRVSSHGGLYLDVDDKIRMSSAEFLSPDDIEVTRGNWQKLGASGIQFFEWEFRVLERGAERVAAELRTALAAKGHVVNVATGKWVSHPASLAITLAEPRERPVAQQPASAGNKRYWGRPYVAKRYNRCSRTIARWIKTGVLPPPDLVLSGNGFWLEETLDRNDREQTAAAANSKPNRQYNLPGPSSRVAPR